MTDTHPLDGFLATPSTGTGPAVLLLHAWWGLNETMRTLATRLANEGFVVFAPDLYDGKIADDIDGAEALMRKLDSEKAREGIAQAMRFLEERGETGKGGIAVVGFSLGVSFAMDLSVEMAEKVGAVVVFYGAIPGDYAGAKAAYLGHFAENDDFEPREVVDEMEADLRKAGRPVTFYHYPDTGHWFFEPDRDDAYNPEAASLAWERTLAFLKEQAAG